MFTTLSQELVQLAAKKEAESADLAATDAKRVKDWIDRRVETIKQEMRDSPPGSRIIILPVLDYKLSDFETQQIQALNAELGVRLMDKAVIDNLGQGQADKRLAITITREDLLSLLTSSA